MVATDIGQLTLCLPAITVPYNRCPSVAIAAAAITHNLTQAAQLRRRRRGKHLLLASYLSYK